MSAAARTESATSSNTAMIPSPVCFSSRPWCKASPRLTRALCTRTSSSAAASPRRVVISVDPTMSVNMTARGPAPISGAVASGACRGSLMRPRNASTAARSTAMISDAICPCASRCTHAAVSASGASTRQKPVDRSGSYQLGHVFDPILVLNFQVLAVRFRNVLRRRSAYIVAVHEDRHAPIPFFHASRSRSDVLVDAEQVLRVKFGFDGGEPFGITEVGPPNAILVVLRYEVHVRAAGRE